MTDQSTEIENVPNKKSKLPLILGLVLAIAAGTGGFYASINGLILASSDPNSSLESTDEMVSDDVTFVALDPLVISLPASSDARHLRFRAQLEVPSQYQADVEKVMPRVLDVLNSYLRALKITDIEDVSALIRLRAQMLRRVRIVVGQGKVTDLLIMEFVLT